MSLKAGELDEVAVVREALFRSGLVPHQRSMADVGARMGSSLGPFVRSGWDVWAFEPSTIMYDRLIERYGAWRNLQVFPVAVSDTVVDEETCLVSDESLVGDPALDPALCRKWSGRVATRRLDALPVSRLDFLKVGAEGCDRNVFRSRGSLAPRVIVTEYEDNKTLALGYSSGEYADELTNAGYRLWVSEWDSIARHGGEHSWRQLYRYAGIAPDSSTRGNFIAIHERVDVPVATLDGALTTWIDEHAGR